MLGADQPVTGNLLLISAICHRKEVEEIEILINMEKTSNGISSIKY
jgi:hypothetical protein